jgi:hypothetical protein
MDGVASAGTCAAGWRCCQTAVRRKAPCARSVVSNVQRICAARPACSRSA